MGKNATVRLSRPVVATVVLAVSSYQGLAQTPAPDWRRVGNTLIDRGLAGLASGPVDRVWYSPDGSKLLLRASNGLTFETADFEKWTASASVPPARTQAGLLVPESSALAVKASGQTPRAYAIGRFGYRSDDGGRNWENLTAFRSTSILGEGLRDLAIHPSKEDEVVIAGLQGVFRSLDAGKSWSSLNQGLPNLPAARLRGLPSGTRGVRVELADATNIEWQPGERTAWQEAERNATVIEISLRQWVGAQRNNTVTAVATSGRFVYAGMADGSIEVSPDGGQGTWLRFAAPGGGAVTRIWADAEDGRLAIATRQGAAEGRVLRTINGGAFWDDLSTGLPVASVQGVTADRETGTIYLATDRGVYLTKTDLLSLVPPAPWSRLAGLPDASVADVRLDDASTQLWALVYGHGVFATLAPHRFADPRVVNAADLALRATAPGALMSVRGAKVDAARSGDLAVPVLDANELESQIQIPFDAKGDTVSLSIDSGGTRRQMNSISLRNASPAIFVNRDGAPMILDADSGTMLDAMHPARSRSRVQILATGLGAVTPQWLAGLAAPLENPPQVSASVRAWLDRSPIEVTRAVLAPGYIGFYLIEVEIPAIVNYGPAELYIETTGQASNRVRVYLEP